MTYIKKIPKRIGVIGLGNMGRPMASNLIRAGYTVVGFDLSAAAVARAADDGVEPAEGPASMATQCDVILIMMRDDEALRGTVFGPDGLLEGKQLRACAIDLSTTSVAVAREVGHAFALRGGVFLDGAVIGGGVAAVKSGTSPIVIAGDRATSDRCLPVLAALGECHYVGAQGNAKVVKVINNFLVGTVTAANAEALALGTAMGLELADLVDWLCKGPGSSRVLETYLRRYVEDGIYAEGLIGHRLMAKDMQVASELAESLEVPALFARLGQQMYLTFGRALGADQPFPTSFDYFRHGRGAGNDLSPGR